MATKAPKAAKAAKPPAERTIKSFFKSLEAGKVEDIAKQLPKLGPHLEGSYYEGYAKKPAIVAAAGSRAGNVEIVRMLLDAGADIDAKDGSQRTALHAACDAGTVEIVKLLIERGAKVDALDKDGKRAYAHAVRNGVEIRKLLRAAGDPGFGPRGGRVIPAKVQDNAKNMEIERGSLDVNPDGSIWFCGYSGLFRYDGKSMTRYTFEEHYFGTNVCSGPRGVMYFATNFGLTEFRDGTITAFDPTNSELFDSHITDMYGAPDGKIYLLSYESERDHKHITVFDGTTFTILEPGVDFPAELEIKCLAFDQDGKLVIGADDALATQKPDGTWHVQKDFDKAVYTPHIYDAIVDGERQWIANAHGLLVKRAGEPYKIVRMPSGAAYSCCLDKDGQTVWLAYRGGVAKLVGDELTAYPKEDSELQSDDVKKVVRDANGRIWIHSGGGAAYVENGEIVRFD